MARGASDNMETLSERAERHAPAFLIGHVQDIIGEQGHVGGLALHDLLQGDWDLALVAVAFAAVDVGFFRGVGHEALGEGEHLEDGRFGAVTDGKGAGGFDVAEHVDFAAFGDAHFFAAVEDHVQLGVGCVDQAFHEDALGQRRRACRWGRVTRISAPASGARPPARVMASSRVTGKVA